MINKDKIEQTKQTIVSIMSSNIDSLFKELDIVLKSIEEGESKLVSLSLDYTNLENEINESKNNIQLEINKLNRNKAEHIEDVNNFKIQVDKFEKRKNEFENNINSYTKIKDKLVSDIDLLNKELKSLDTKIKAKIVLANELDVVKKELSDKNSSLKDIIEKVEALKTEKTKLKQELDKINKDIEEKRNIVLPTIEELKEREKILSIKESDLQIIIDRYKKLYAEKGSGFNI